MRLAAVKLWFGGLLIGYLSQSGRPALHKSFVKKKKKKKQHLESLFCFFGKKSAILAIICLGVLIFLYRVQIVIIWALEHVSSLGISLLVI